MQVTANVPAQPIRVSGAAGALPIIEKLAAAYEQETQSVRFRFDEGTNSGGAIRGVSQQLFDIAVSDRPVSESERTDDLLAIPFARDAVVFAVNRRAPIQPLTSGDVREIYQGNISDWGQLGAEGGAMFVLSGNPNETARNSVLIPIMENTNIDARAIVLASDREMVRALENTPDSFGYAPRGLLSLLHAKKVTPVTLDGTEASVENVQRNVYPWQLTYFLVHHRLASPAVREFVEWVAGPGGRQVLEAHGYASPQQ